MYKDVHLDESRSNQLTVITTSHCTCI